MLTALLLFGFSLAVMAFASVVLTDGLKDLAVRLRLPETVLGIFAALGADSPEIASAIVALTSKYHDIGFGVVLGSNVFNLAGLLGVSALMVGRLKAGAETAILNGGANLIVTFVALAFILGWLPPWLAVSAFGLVLVPYFFLSNVKPGRLERLKVPSPFKRFLGTLAQHTATPAGPRGARPSAATWKLAVAVLAAAVTVAGASLVMVHAAVALADAWRLPHLIMGALVLASLTSIPNMLAAIRLAADGRAVAVVSETFSSNTFNILVGIGTASFAIGTGKPSPQVVFSALWLLVMSVYAMKAAGSELGFRRRDGAVIISLYAIFAVVVSCWR